MKNNIHVSAIIHLDFSRKTDMVYSGQLYNTDSCLLEQFEVS